jgi:nicotinate-nucleotide pyrophosphorylase (carboxylating)
LFDYYSSTSLLIHTKAMTLFNHLHSPNSSIESETFQQLVAKQVTTALEEDIGSGDLTALLIPATQQAIAIITVREEAVICGIAWVEACFKQIDPDSDIHWFVQEGERVRANQVLCEIKALARTLLTAERCALNFLQTLSATATQTRQYVDAISGTQAKILDTRKTLPHLRHAQKYAVTVGGGQNQRMALYDGILIKENHIAAAGSIQAVMNQAFALSSGKSIQIEVETLSQLEEALSAGANNILLDNFDIDALIQAVALNSLHSHPAILEASGGIHLQNVREIALTGVDRISIGSLTKNIQAIDLSMRIKTIN